MLWDYDGNGVKDLVSYCSYGSGVSYLSVGITDLTTMKAQQVITRGVLWEPGFSFSKMTLGKQLTRRIIHTGEWRKAISYYGKNMMNGSENSIYKELIRALLNSSSLGDGLNFTRSIIRVVHD